MGLGIVIQGLGRSNTGLGTVYYKVWCRVIHLEVWGKSIQYNVADTVIHGLGHSNTGWGCAYTMFGA